MIELPQSGPLPCFTAELSWLRDVQVYDSSALQWPVGCIAVSATRLDLSCSVPLNAFFFMLPPERLAHPRLRNVRQDPV